MNLTNRQRLRHALDYAKDLKVSVAIFEDRAKSSVYQFCRSQSAIAATDTRQNLNWQLAVIAALIPVRNV